ncbi:hypothetical protein CSOJ01_15503 [Colletotrichum sojae]|uniref:T6SS Phospholipase effector Tle1-like catalytic domain-containing protein n=1 Tax=Colletotrichum sojae TaxID=2175907 RepID=A0A8H6IMP9_9PEZI|nr:hypothetical protein CSOJ01_15503 [Colletotrichum sojae]
MSCSTITHDNAEGHTPLKPCVHHKSLRGAHKKRLVICCDGTWNNSNESGSISTNVGRLSTAFAHKCCSGMAQVVYYHRGAGTDKSLVSKALGGLFGVGVVADIADVYRFVCDNYTPSDEIVFIGFSRGAFTARSVAGMICAIGLLNGFGLANFGAIFKDYSNFSGWKKGVAFDKDNHLLWINRANLYHVLREVTERERKNKDGDTQSTKPEKPEEEEEQEVLKVRKLIFNDIINDSYARCVDKLWKDMDEAEQEKVVANVVESQRLLHLAKIYQEYLQMAGMLLDQEFDPDTHEIDWDAMIKQMAIDKEPRVIEDVKVKAVGVWDTVGSLGIPYDPRTEDRSDNEIRFASHNVDPRIENAFHALALDETRGPFKPTLWNRMENEQNKKETDGMTGMRYKWDEVPGTTDEAEKPTTLLRQVWFPGNHSDVGGGLATQQIATISLAWMADQLSSIGVEFNPEEMTRIFVNAGWEGGWALGRINSPEKWTGWIDKAMNWDGEEGKRTPGMSVADGKDTGNPTVLANTHELVHPSVRIRYMYAGKGPENAGDWRCDALTDARYVLQRHPVKGKKWPAWAGEQHEHSSTYETLNGRVVSIRGGTTVDPTDGFGAQHMVVPKQLPYNEELYKPSKEKPSEEKPWEDDSLGYVPLTNEPPEHNPLEKWRWETDEQLGDRSDMTWVWSREKPDSHKCRYGPENCKTQCGHWIQGPVTLHEERIGMWERQFIKVVSRGPMFRPLEPAARNLVGRTWDAATGFLWGTAKSATKAVTRAVTFTGGVVMTPYYFGKKRIVKIIWGGAVNRGQYFTGLASKEELLRGLKRDHEDVGQYGYHDLIAWQQGDARPRPVVKDMGVTKKTSSKKTVKKAAKKAARNEKIDGEVRVTVDSVEI